MRQLCFSIIAFLWFPVFVSGQELQYDQRLVTGKLKNGLTYYIYPNDNPKGEAVYRLFVKAGSAMENEDQRGLAHFIEHMAFNGTSHFPDDGIVKFLESKGAKFGKDLNAHTAFTETVYKLQLPSADAMMVDSTLTILADWAAGLTFDPVQVDKERGVILSEWLSRGGNKQDQKVKLLMELLNDSRYSKRMTIGDTAVIRHASPRVMRDYYEKWYTPQLMAVAVVGDIDPVMIKSLITKKFSKLKRSRVPADWQQPMIPAYSSDKAIISVDSTATKTELDFLQLLPLPTPVQRSEDYRSYLLRSVINRLMKQRFASLSFDNPAYDDGGIQYSRFLNATGVTDASVTLADGKIEKGIRDFVAHQQQIFRYGFTAAEISRVKKSLLRAIQNQATTKQKPQSIEIMNEIYSDYYEQNKFVSKQDELSLVERYLPQIDSVSVLNEIQQVFLPHKTHYLLRGGTMMNDEVGSEDALMKLIKTASETPVNRYYKNIVIPDELCGVAPQDHIVSEKAIPEIDATDIRLDNGARVIFKQSLMDKDRVMLSGFRKGGQYALDSLHYYTGLVAPNVISLSGAGDFTRDALSYYLAGNSASVRFLVDKLRTGLLGTARLTDMETMFQLLYLKWTQPRVDTATASLVMDKLIENYLTKRKTPTEIFGQQLGWLLSGRNYTNAVLTDTIVRQLVKPADMLPLYKRFFGTADQFTFLFLGDCTLEEARPLISTYIGALPKGKFDEPWLVQDRNIPHAHKQLVSYTGDQQKATVTLVYQQDKPIGTYQVMDPKSDIVSSVIRSMLLRRLREDMGKVYSVSVSSSSTQYPSYLSRTTIAFSCQPADVDTLIRATMQQLELLYSHPERFNTEIEDVKRNLIKDHELQVQKTSYWSAWIRNAVYNEQEDWTRIVNYDTMVRRITPRDIADYAIKAVKDAYSVEAVLYPKTEKEKINHKKIK